MPNPQTPRRVGVLAAGRSVSPCEPSTGFDRLASERLRHGVGKLFPVGAVHPQGDAAIELDPPARPRTGDTGHSATKGAKPLFAIVQARHREDILPPQPSPGGSRALLSCMETSREAQVRGYHDLYGEPCLQQGLLQAASVGAKGMGQGAFVVILRILSYADPEGPASQKSFGKTGRRIRTCLFLASVVRFLGCIHTDQANTASIGKGKGVAVEHPLKPYLL